VAPRRHVTAVAELSDLEVAELGPLLRRTSQVVERLCSPEQVYVCLWSHGEGVRRHLHIVVQPVTADLVAKFGGARSEQLQALMLAAGDHPDVASIESFAERARREFDAPWCPALQVPKGVTLPAFGVTQ
jgi:ATP adenylyltransferase